MDLYKTKYETMPDNLYFDRRMASGEQLSEIFDDVDYKSKHYTEDKERPITVRVGQKYNYVVNNYLLFDNWFVLCDDFNEYDKCTFAYRRYNEKGIREGGVIIRRDGSYVTREEFLDINYTYMGEHGKYAFVKQYDGLLNIIDTEKGIKIDKTGIKADCITYASVNYISCGLFIIARGNIKNIYDIEWIGASCGEEETRERNIKCNFYSVEKGVLSPSLWFDYVENFKTKSNGYRQELFNHAIVHLNGKSNYIDQKGTILSDKWFDAVRLYYSGDGLAGILKSDCLKSLPDYLDDNYDFNPNKYNLFKIDTLGRIRAV